MAVSNPYSLAPNTSPNLTGVQSGLRPMRGPNNNIFENLTKTIAQSIKKGDETKDIAKVNLASAELEKQFTQWQMTQQQNPQLNGQDYNQVAEQKWQDLTLGISKKYGFRLDGKDKYSMMYQTKALNIQTKHFPKTLIIADEKAKHYVKRKTDDAVFSVYQNSESMTEKEWGNTAVQNIAIRLGLEGIQMMKKIKYIDEERKKELMKRAKDKREYAEDSKRRMEVDENRREAYENLKQRSPQSEVVPIEIEGPLVIKGFPPLEKKPIIREKEVPGNYKINEDIQKQNNFRIRYGELQNDFLSNNYRMNVKSIKKSSEMAQDELNRMSELATQGDSSAKQYIAGGGALVKYDEAREKYKAYMEAYIQSAGHYMDAKTRHSIREQFDKNWDRGRQRLERTLKSRDAFNRTYKQQVIKKFLEDFESTEVENITTGDGFNADEGKIIQFENNVANVVDDSFTSLDSAFESSSPGSGFTEEGNLIIDDTTTEGNLIIDDTTTEATQSDKTKIHLQKKVIEDVMIGEIRYNDVTEAGNVSQEIRNKAKKYGLTNEEINSALRPVSQDILSYLNKNPNSRLRNHITLTQTKDGKIIGTWNTLGAGLAVSNRAVYHKYLRNISNTKRTPSEIQTQKRLAEADEKGSIGWMRITSSLQRDLLEGRIEKKDYNNAMEIVKSKHLYNIPSAYREQYNSHKRMINSKIATLTGAKQIDGVLGWLDQLGIKNNKSYIALNQAIDSYSRYAKSKANATGMSYEEIMDPFLRDIVKQLNSSNTVVIDIDGKKQTFRFYRESIRSDISDTEETISISNQTSAVNDKDLFKLWDEFKDTDETKAYDILFEIQNRKINKWSQQWNV